mmetsp:Transcript_8948/g.13208  ORF Transcript_8948/g.13208 Transcript_8948/m.13208 type:complete len:123 (+) Transcript_8948:227-595(+)
MGTSASCNSADAEFIQDGNHDPIIAEVVLDRQIIHTSGSGIRQERLDPESAFGTEDEPPPGLWGVSEMKQAPKSNESGEEDDIQEKMPRRIAKLSRPTQLSTRIHQAKVMTSACCSAVGFTN